MFSRRTLTVWIGILLLSGMFLTGQETWPPPQCPDGDRDGYGAPASASCAHPELDCDDSNAEVNPGIIEGPDGDPRCSDGLDNDCDGLVDNLDGGCLDMVQIPAGCFNMGDALNEGWPDELPVHSVCISTFEMDVHEVTNAEYKACADAGQCTPPLYSSSQSRSSYYGNPVYDHFPVIYVAWSQAADYCTWAGKRLSTEAEWEYAARGGLADKRYPWGDTMSFTDANFWASGDPWDNDTSLVEYYDPRPTSPNGYGLYDMAGNVWEWVNDWYSSTYYQYCVDNGVSNDPPGPPSGTERIARGGSWGSAYTEKALRVSARYSPEYLFVYPDLGFRCSR